MASCSHQAEVKIPIESLWEFVSNIDRWAPLVPGYNDHTIINDRESTWSFYTDVGIMKKKIQLKVEIETWQEPEKVTFNLEGINEKISGEGYFWAKKENRTNIMTGCLTIRAEGLMAKMANSILSSSLPSITVELTEAVARKAEENYNRKIKTPL